MIYVTHFTEEQKAIILDGIMPYKDKLFAKLSATITQQRKCSIYSKVLDHFQSPGIEVTKKYVTYFRDKNLDNIKRPQWKIFKFAEEQAQLVLIIQLWTRRPSMFLTLREFM